MGIEGLLGPTIWTATIDKVVNWCRQYSFWPFPFGTACCAIEFMAAFAPDYDIARFGAERTSFTPRQADVMVVAGTITNKMVPAMMRIYHQIPEPRWVMAMGACACSGGPFNTYSVVQGIDTLIPVDFYIPGCPPRPEGLLDAIVKLQKHIQSDTVMKAAG